MRLVVTSYTHGLHDQIEPLSDGEVIAHAAGTFENDDTRFIQCRLPQRAVPAGETGRHYTCRRSIGLPGPTRRAELTGALGANP